MGVTLKPSALASEISDIIQQYSDEVVRAMPDAVKSAAKAAKKSLKANAPAKTGAYKGSFTSKTTQSSSSINTIEVYSTKPGLPHLLEFGHTIRNQYGVYGRTRAFPHWATAEEAAEKAFEEEIQKRVEAAG